MLILLAILFLGWVLYKKSW